MIEYQPGMEIVAPCYIKNMPSEVYHAHHSISNSGLKLVERSPAHYMYAPKREVGRNMVVGSALHMAILEPDLFWEKYAILDDGKDRRSKEYKELVSVYGSDYVITNEESLTVEGIVRSLVDNDEICSYLAMPGVSELSGFSIDIETGVTCRHRFDKLLNSGIAIDLKTTIDARPDAFSRAVYNYNYHVQTAFYSDQYEWITGRTLTDFIFIVVESESPYACKMYRLDAESVNVGRDTYRRALDEYAKCKASGSWTAYDNHGVEEISIPKWALNKYDDQLMENFEFVENEV